ncbi:MAG TPA: PAS domain S-box protein, partial [Tichowtungia sp.]|nr:PAS domain S-box protein [Tichowtungia sp.]
MALTLPELSATAQVGLIAGVIGLFLLFTAGFVMTLVYRKRFLIFSKKCSALDADLGKTRRELLGTKNLLAEKSRSHRQMLDTAGAAIFELSEAGECIYANAALGALLGVPEGHLLGDGLIGFVHPDDRERVRQQWLNFDKRKPSLRMSFRFQIADGKDVYVTERGSLLINARKKVSGYFGQIMDVGEQMSECLEARRVERRTDRFIEQTTDGFYRLSLTEPVSVSLSPEQITDHIEQHAVLASCSANLAALYGRTAEQMTGRALKEIPGGFGVFEGKDQIRQFVENGFSVSGRDSDFTDHRGKPRCLNHQAVGIMQNNQLTAVWGTVRDSTLEKREAEDARCHEAFLRQILDSLPCDVSAKDPRCRYVYVNRKFEERTGTPREDWEGKTVFQLVPGAPREFNRLSIEAMKTGTTCRRTDLTETAGRKRWIETIEAPLVGAEGVIEGVVGFSMDMTEIKKNEAQLRSECDALRRSLKESEDAVSAASAARLESVQQRDALSAEMKKTQEMLESREA